MFNDKTCKVTLGFEYTILLKPALGTMRDVTLFSISHEQT